MVFWGQIQNYMMRVNLSILIVAMVKDPLPQGKHKHFQEASERQSWLMGLLFILEMQVQILV
jgi:hypothetical protein